MNVLERQFYGVLVLVVCWLMVWLVAAFMLLLMAIALLVQYEVLYSVVILLYTAICHENDEGDGEEHESQVKISFCKNNYLETNIKIFKTHNMRAIP